MSKLLPLVLVVGCADDPADLRVWMSSAGVSVQARSVTCMCERSFVPEIGRCHSFTDTRRADDDPCTCAAPDICARSARVERDGTTVAESALMTTDVVDGADIKHARLDGDLAGATLVLEGCNEDVIVDLPSYPPAPQITSITGGGGATHIEWIAPPSIDMVQVRIGVLYGESCVVGPDVTSIDVFGDAKATVTSIRAPPIVTTDLGPLQLYATATASP